MKFEIKIVILSFIFSLFCIGVFVYGASLTQKTMYVYQVGIYKEEENKNNKLSELKEKGIQGYAYQKENQYYVLSMISDNKKEIEEHASQNKGIIKRYTVSNQTTKDKLLEKLSEGELND